MGRDCEAAASVGGGGLLCGTGRPMPRMIKAPDAEMRWAEEGCGTPCSVPTAVLFRPLT